MSLIGLNALSGEAIASVLFCLPSEQKTKKKKNKRKNNFYPWTQILACLSIPRLEEAYRLAPMKKKEEESPGKYHHNLLYYKSEEQALLHMKKKKR